ncbi:hypothetical protein GMA19_02726 [Paenibacillus polymyxa E681]|uniref:hypothetical protein n=1 Tax=Paenibacillus polymyxa TaxID=1406 RepID=UPI0001E3207F|nr:hypothetical protein [Paenibacillus polymyxa]ADM70530.1 hypothetical protein PPE_02702 [Paenibacillus polymyxa E681]QNV57556.1 hypothetical protein GE561_02726 [Paenibacillus polymyxa E681]QNV62393.1 hypothetical protein GMA19_02726 [Paenibacillus polymyxa E681]
MKLRVVPIVVAAVLAALLLFGGWFIYRQVTMQSPLEKIVSQYPGVTSAQIDIKQDQVVLKLDLKPQADVAGLVDVVKQKGQSIIGSRTIKLDIADHSNVALNQWWSEAMFPVAEAMENKKYTQISSTVEQMKKKKTDIKADTDMDSNNVYIRLSEGKATKFIVLPRQSQQMGVWPNA